jgi:hypothetical protein
VGLYETGHGAAAGARAPLRLTGAMGGAASAVDRAVKD